jgi:hypothetical protein
MRTQSPDTDADAERIQILRLRIMPVWQRLAQVDAMNAMAEAFTLAGLRRLHPGADNAQLHRMLVARRLLALGIADDLLFSKPEPGGGA